MQVKSQNQKVSTPKRYQSGKLKYDVKLDKDIVNVNFLDRFGVKYLSVIKPSLVLDEELFKQYKSRKRQTRLQFKLKNQQLKAEKIQALQQQLIKQLKQHLDLDYCYFKKFKNQSQQEEKHIDRNNQIKNVCEKQFFKTIYKEVTGLVLIDGDLAEKETIKTQGDVSNQFSRGELILYVESHKKHKVKHIIQYLQTYTSQKVIFGLDEYLGPSQLKSSEFSFSETKNILQKVIQHLDEELISIGIENELQIKGMRILDPTDIKKSDLKGYEGKFGVEFDIEGIGQTLPQFYFSISKVFENHPITYGKVQNIQLRGNFAQTQKHYQDSGTVLFFGSDNAVAVLNLHKSFKQFNEFKRQLRKGEFLISQANGFTRDQLAILIKQHRQLQLFMNQYQHRSFVNYTFKPNNERSFFIICERYVEKKFVSLAFEYLKRNKKEEVKREEFVTEFEIFLFMNLIRNQIEVNYPTVRFYVKDGALWSSSKVGDLESIETELQNQRRKILKKIVRLPTLKPLKKSHQYQIIQDEAQTEEFCSKASFRTVCYKFLPSNINIFIKSIKSITSCRPFLISIIDRNYEDCQFMMDSFKQNSLSLDRYEKLSSGWDKKQERSITYCMTKSKYVNQVLVWFIEFDEKKGMNSKKLRWDMNDFVRIYRAEQTLQFVIPAHMAQHDFYFGTFFFQLFKQIQIQGDSKIKTVNIFYEGNNQKKVHQIAKRTFQKVNGGLFHLQTQMHLSQAELEKIILLENYSVRYWRQNENKFLSPLNSFVFKFEKSKRISEFRVPLFLQPYDKVQTQYLLNLREDSYFKIQKGLKISQFKIEVNKILQEFAKIIKQYFKNSEYLVAYMNKQQTQIQGKIMYFWSSSDASNQNIQQRIKRFEVNEQKKLIPKKNSQIDIFVKQIDKVPKYIIQTHSDFIPTVKKLIFQQD